MIERSSYGLRHAEFQRVATWADRHAWQFEATSPPRTTRAVLARALIALATRLDPAVPAATTPLLASGRGGA